MHPHFLHDAVARERENVPSPVRREQQMAGESGNRETQLRHSRAQASLARLSLFNQPLKLATVEIGMRALGDRRPARRFAFHAVAPPGFLAFEPWSRDIAERDRVAVAIVAIGCTRRAFAAFSPSSRRLPSSADG